MMPALRRTKNWWDQYNQHDAGIEAVVADKENVPQAPQLMMEDRKITSPGSHPRIGPTNPVGEIRLPSGSIVPEVKVENPKGTTFTTAKVNPAQVLNHEAFQIEKTTRGVINPKTGEALQGSLTGTPISGVHGAVPQITAPPLPTNPNYDQELAAYQAEMKRGPQKQGAASQALFQAAQFMANFGRGMQGQEMQPFQWLGEAKDQRRDAQAAKRFAPYQAERNQQVENWKTQTKTAIDINEANIKNRKTEAEIAELNRKGTEVDYEYREAEGKTFSKRKGAPDTEWKEVEALRDRTKMPVEQELDDGTGRKVFLTGNQLVDDLAQKADRQARLEFEKGKYSQSHLDDYRKRLETWQKESAETENERAKLEAQAVEKDGETKSKRGASEDFLRRAGMAEAEGDTDRAEQLRNEAEKLRQQASQAEAAAAGIRRQKDKIKVRPAPKLQTTSIPTEAPTTGSKAPSRRVNSSQLEQLSKQTGKSIEELKRMAKKEGYSID